MAVHLAIERRMAGAGHAVHHRDVLPIRVSVGGFLHGGLASGHVTALQVGLVDGFQAARAAQLDQLGIALAIHQHLLAPPTL
ncbi:hypothetical protein D9M69_656320 [compost metagenome]